MDTLWQLWQAIITWLSALWIWIDAGITWLQDSVMALIVRIPWQRLFSWDLWDSSVQYVVGIATVIGALSTMVGFFQLIRNNRLHKTRRQEEVLGKLVSLTSALVFELKSLTDFDLDEIREARKELLKCVQGEAHILDAELRSDIKQKWLDINKKVLAFTKKYRMIQDTTSSDNTNKEIYVEGVKIAEHVRRLQSDLETAYQHTVKKLP